MGLAVHLLTGEVGSIGRVVDAGGSGSVLEEEVLVRTQELDGCFLAFLGRVFSVVVFVQQGGFFLILGDVSCTEGNRKDLLEIHPPKHFLLLNSFVQYCRTSGNERGMEG